jgi:hypothetical protein
MVHAIKGKESFVERKCGRLAKQAGCILLKMRIKGWPDRILIAPNGRVAFIEFKREDGELEPLQRYHLRLLRTMKFQAEECDNVELFERILSETLGAT